MRKRMTSRSRWGSKGQVSVGCRKSREVNFGIDISGCLLGRQKVPIFPDLMHGLLETGVFLLC